MENCIDYGEKGDRFFIIISGIVSVVIPNPLIKNRALQRRDYEQLQLWKQNDFDPRVEIAKKEQHESYQEEKSSKQEVERLNRVKTKTFSEKEAIECEMSAKLLACVKHDDEQKPTEQLPKDHDHQNTDHKNPHDDN